MNHRSAEEVTIPNYVKVLIRCLTVLLRNQITVDTLATMQNSKPLMAIVQVIRFAREEEMVANSLKIVRYCLKEERYFRKIV